MNLLSIANADLTKTNDKFDANLIPILERFLSMSQHIDTQPGSFTDYVGRLINTSLIDGSITSKEIASRIGLTDSKLRRTLKSEGTSFKRLLLSKRLDLAKRLLIDSNATILEIAIRCGYSETASFSRAFSRQAGMTPTKFRRSPK